jgi:hypothetical protein
MKTLYKEQFGYLNLEFIKTQDDKFDIWKTTLTSRKTNKTIELRIDSAYRHIEFEKRGESPAALYNLLGSFIIGKSVYVIYDKLGTVELCKYEFISPTEFKETNKLLENYFVTPALGRSKSNVYFKKIGDNIYFLLNLGQSFNTPKYSFLHKINDSMELNVKKLVFDLQSSESVTTVRLDDDSRRFINSVSEDDVLSAVLQKEYDIFKQHYDSTYYHKEISSDPQKQHMEVGTLHRQGLFPYDLYEDAKKTGKIESLLKEILQFINQDTDIKYIDGIEYKEIIHDDEQYSIIYFFYRNRMNKVNIIKYMGKNAIWLISDYIEKEIKIENP